MPTKTDTSPTIAGASETITENESESTLDMCFQAS